MMSIKMTKLVVLLIEHTQSLIYIYSYFDYIQF